MIFYLKSQLSNSSFRSHLAAKAYGVLTPDKWDDFGFKTGFQLTIYDENGKAEEIGFLKIGYKGQMGGWTADILKEPFESLPEGFFSVGLSVDYYENIYNKFTPKVVERILKALSDLAFNTDLIELIKEERVFKASFLRAVSIKEIRHQFARILNGSKPLKDFKFYFHQYANDEIEHSLSFLVDPTSFPPSNIHALIGRNGVGKTTLLKNIAKSFVKIKEGLARYGITGLFETKLPILSTPLQSDYFENCTFVSFSAFDSFDLELKNKPDLAYVGLSKEDNQTKSKEDLINDFISSLNEVFISTDKVDLWLSSITNLKTDPIFSDLDLHAIAELHPEYSKEEKSSKNDFKLAAKELFAELSSGHAIVLLTLTRLVECVKQQSLVLVDEPESHLHPPLLASFIRALSELLRKRNGVAIMTTHSPVVLQEVPKSCVYIINRSGDIVKITRPEQETFAENIGTLTREVFRLELEQSGYFSLIKQLAEGQLKSEEILEKNEAKLGFEGQILLRNALSNKTSPDNGVET